MANNLTNAEEDRLLDTSLNGTYLALFTSDPTETGAAGTEVTGGAYARQAVTWGAASGGTKQPTADVIFPEATAGWGTVTHAALMTASSGGTARWYGPLAVSRNVVTGVRFRVLSTDLTCTLN